MSKSSAFLKRFSARRWRVYVGVCMLACVLGSCFWLDLARRVAQGRGGNGGGVLPRAKGSSDSDGGAPQGTRALGSNRILRQGNRGQHRPRAPFGPKPSGGASNGRLSRQSRLSSFKQGTVRSVRAGCRLQQQQGAMTERTRLGKLSAAERLCPPTTKNGLQDWRKRYLPMRQMLQKDDFDRILQLGE